MNPLYFNPNYYNKPSLSNPVRMPACGRGQGGPGCGLGLAGRGGCGVRQCASCPFNNNTAFNPGYGKCRMMGNQRCGCPYGIPENCPFRR